MRLRATWKKRWVRGTRHGCALLLGLYLVAVLGGWMNPSTPVDYAMNLGTFPRQEELAAPVDGRVRLVVLQHGMWRSAGSLWKLERALRAHGYRVINSSYPSTTRRIEEHADALGMTLGAELAEPVDELYFVGHSMGGLVLQAYLLHPDAPQPLASVFLGTPHRGAVLADLRREGFLFKLTMGYQASLQLSPKHAFNQREIRIPGAVGTIIGSAGDVEGFNEDIPGDDDGTVAVREAHLEGEDDSVTVPVGHTRLSFHDRSIRQVLYFLKHRVFAQ